MSEHSISIVPKKSFYSENERKAKEILGWLISKDIVKAELSDCILSSDKGYAVSEGARYITDYPDALPFFLSTNGLEIIISKEVFHAGETGMEECICPNCNQDIVKEEWSFIDVWFSEGLDESVCPLCNEVFDIHQLKISPEWGFSNLGFKFWNWPDFKISFIEEFSEILQCKAAIVHQHL